MSKKAKKKVTYLPTQTYPPAFMLDEDSPEQRDQRFVKKVTPRNDNQAKLLESIQNHHLVLALGPAGTGKTYLAIASAVDALETGQVGRIILARPAIGAGEELGFLPGDIDNKLAPYLRPLYDALTDRLGKKKLRQYLIEGTIEIAPIAYMRGRTLNNAFIIIDEAQNCTFNQIKMLLTRLGWHSTMVLTGDPDQSDLLDGMSGLSVVADKLSRVEDIAVTTLTHRDVVRHPLVASVINAL